MVVAPAEGGPAALISLPVIAAVAFGIYQLEDRKFLMRLFVAGFLLRVLVGTVIYIFHWQEYFGGDVVTRPDSRRPPAILSFAIRALRPWTRFPHEARLPSRARLRCRPP